MPALPLEGVRVIDLTEVWAGPMGTSLLGDMGAHVIKVESYPRASMTRPVTIPPGQFGIAGRDPDLPRPWDRSATHNMANRNKHAIALNLQNPQGKGIFKDLVALSDVLVEGYSAGTLQRLGLDFAALQRVNPGLVMVSMPGWGSDGPYAGYVTLGSGIDAVSGHHALRGYPGSDPTEAVPCVHSDSVAAVTLVFAVVTALIYRRRTAKGQWIDLSQAEAFLPHLAYPFLDYVMNGRVAQPLGNHDRWMAPHSCYPCQGEDEWIAICVATDAQWQALCRVAGHVEWEEDPRFADVTSRFRHQQELDDLLASWTKDYDKRALAQVLQEAGVPAGPVLQDTELFSDPHLTKRGLFEEVTHSVVGTHLYPGMLWKFSGTSMGIRIPSNALGEHNHLVLQTLLGLSPEECQKLETVGIIGDTYSPLAGIDPRDQVASESPSH